MSSKQHDNLRSQPKLLLLRVETCCLALVLWGNLRTEACKFVHAFCAFFTESHEVHCQSKSRRINQINREKKPPVEQILGLRQGIIPVLRQLAINHSALELRGELRLLLLVLLQFKSRHPKNLPFGLISLKVTLKNHSKKFKVRNGRDQGWKVNRSGRLPHLLPGCLLLSTCLCVLAEGVIHLLWHLTG